ncbi:alpha-1,3-galactosidase-related protein [Flammeovirga kamogawensis]|uniref:Right-handed parallel beta-helix repeat-containing protein n=1 Tax=Flammeovirga kamogawensis TaxID=373891 RepID=A0ABX8H3Z1_9BACT|nr:right-handed parallel beta-helix repeat-containing protein [Flammeovirga kamogawensis]MBB6461698.1 hypothetical protein [Flammeovirga kamogawensis]QWG10618.1 right-handed parallel beta-helix repeat-containing protein [Flammeovirga kamogawensis]TRX63723.1 right-handed parallel beta-helix repeat-containing protein [Flammeovirga kamogawensis]
MCDYKKIIVQLLSVFVFSFSVNAEEVIVLKPQKGDRTLALRTALENVKDKEIKLVFEKGTYFFAPDYAFEQDCYITNHENGIKKIAFHLQDFDKVTIEGNGSDFIFHGQILPFQFDNCNNVAVNDVNIDWDIPFSFQGEVIEVNQKEGWRVIKPFNDGFSWNLKGGTIFFPSIDGFNFSILGSSLPFDKTTKAVVHGAIDHTSKPNKVEKLPNGNLKFYEKLKYYPPVGSIVHSKGKKGENRYAPAFHVIRSKDVTFDKVVVHHALGMGFLAEKSENITIKNSGVYLKEGTDRVVSSLADATHFCNVKGHILIENSRFENMLDDGTNVHGTYVVVDEIVNQKTVRVKLAHFQQTGFEFAGKGDEVWFIHAPSPSRAEVKNVEEVATINSTFSEITFKENLPTTLRKGDVLENKTWNPTFTMRGCEIKNHRARNIVLKSPLKTVIENNTLSSMMSSILFRGETYYWFESGGVEDVLIQNNTFTNCATAGKEHAVMWVTPRLGKEFSTEEIYDKGIKFINNTINTFDARIVRADRTSAVLIKGNTITKTSDFTPLFPNSPMFEFKNCEKVEISNNTYKGPTQKGILLDEKSSKKVKVKNNKGFDIVSKSEM